jgi:protocatechuate 3,4-dioxygenase beta subunit
MPEARKFDRREALVAMGAMGLAAFAAACARRSPSPAATASSAAGASAAPAASSAAGSAACVLMPELTEGPYYIDVDLVRRNITEGRPGVPLQLDLTVQDADSCEPIKDATVEIWHADAGGEYSGFGGASSGSGAGGPPGGPGGQSETTNDLRFLRGAQTSDADGKVTFETIYPGWYQGRAVHIHLKVHPGGNTVHTGQLFFEDVVNSEIAKRSPYASRGTPDVTNGSDGIFGQSGGKSIVAVKKQGSGYVGTIPLAVQT